MRCVHFLSVVRQKKISDLWDLNHRDQNLACKILLAIATPPPPEEAINNTILPAGALCELPRPDQLGYNSHSVPAGRIVYNIYGLRGGGGEVAGRWRGGGGLTRRLQARFWSLVQIPKIDNFFFDGRRTQKMVDK